MMDWACKLYRFPLPDCPNGRKHPIEIAAEDQFDVGIAVLAANQTFRKFKNALGVVHAFDVDFFEESIAAFVAGAQMFDFFLREPIGFDHSR
jgi:hypothetical protein